ncbi:MAG: metallophosphoesterase [Ruminococcaceae bacterium]|nr:metallophosphoesterase [Oscillospiraceae bacterium]
MKGGIITDTLKITVVSDTHYYSKKNGIDGKAFIQENSRSTNLIKDSQEVLEAFFKQIIEDKTNDIIIISGDVTKNGEPDSHIEFIDLLRKVKAAGKRVYVITATHDFHDSGIGHKFVGDEKVETSATTRKELWDLYYEFGPSEAISVHEDSMSYIVQLEDGFRLFALNDDRNHEGKSGFSKDCFKWIEEQVVDAKKNNQLIIPMSHHPVLSPSPFFSLIGKGDMMGDHEIRREQFPDMGVSFMFTGHSHMHDISYHFSKNNNIFYDITTAATVGYPALYRVVTFDKKDGTMQIESKRLEKDPDIQFNGKNFDEHLQNQFFGMIKKTIEAAATSIDEFAFAANAFSVRPKVVYRYGWIFKPIAKLLCKLKIGTVAKWTKKETGLKKSDYSAIKDEKVIDYIISLIQNLYGGDAPYSPDTPHYKVTMGLMSIIDSLLDVLGIKIEKILKVTDNVSDLVEPLVFNSGIPDHNVILPLKATKDDIKKIIPGINSTVKKSKKGLPIIITFALLIIVLLPLIPIALLAVLVAYLCNKIKYADKLKEDV